MSKENTNQEAISAEFIEMEENRRLFRAVFDHTFQFMGILTTEGLLLDANKRALDFVHLGREDVVGKAFWDTPWWTNAPKVQERLKLAVQSAAVGEVVRFDAEHISPEGKPITVDFSLTPVVDKTGAVRLLVAEGRDITERIIAERSLKDREARNRALVDTAPIGICTVTMDGIIESANTSLHKLLGYSKEALNGQPVKVIIENLSGDDTDSSDDMLKTGERKIFGVGRETSASHRDGSKVPVELALSLLNLGHLQVFIVIVRDITERHKSQQLQSQLAAIVESTDDAIYSCDMNSIVTSWNPAAERLYGYKTIEALGHSVTPLVVPHDRSKEVLGFLERLRMGESIGHFETVRRNKEGTPIDVDLTISPIRNSLGQVVGMSTIARDISVRKEAERRISEFYSMVSHELRTPLTSIRASLGLLEGGIAGNIDEEALQLVQIARAESDRLILLINDILDLRKIEAGMLELKLRRVQLSELLNSVLESLRAMADEHNVALRANYSQDWNLVADQDRIIQVIHNLLSNAIKYSRAADIVQVTAEASKRLMRISVIDRGPGIRADQMHKLFGKFQQLDSSDARPQGGTGLGLAISKAIVEQHGGTVGVNSKPGEGSTFWFEIPMTLEIPDLSGAMSGRQSHSSLSRLGHHAAVKPKKDEIPCVLIVEDDKSTLELLTKQLERQNIKCISAIDGNLALQILKTEKPDLLILDLGVPFHDGFELVQILKQGEFADLPLLVYTSMDLSEHDCELLQLGPSKHMIKSMSSQQDIIGAVRELLSQVAE